MLAEAGLKAEPQVTGTLELDPETLAELHGVDEEAEKRVDVPVPAQWQPPTEGNEDEPWSLWKKDMGMLGEVDITDLERRLFVKAVMNDQEVVFDIELKGVPDFKFRVRSLSNRMLRALAMAMGKDGETGMFRDLSVWASRLQYYSVVLQFLGVGDTGEPLLPPKLDKAPIAELCDWLMTNADETLAAISGPRYLAIIQAIRVFEAKLSRCKEGLVNGDFFDTAGTST